MIKVLYHYLAGNIICTRDTRILKTEFLNFEVVPNKRRRRKKGKKGRRLVYTFSVTSSALVERHLLAIARLSL